MTPAPATVCFWKRGMVEVGWMTLRILGKKELGAGDRSLPDLLSDSHVHSLQLLTVSSELSYEMMRDEAGRWHLA